jgi:hypothetical protein
VLCGTDGIMRNILHIHLECEDSNPKQWYVDWRYYEEYSSHPSWIWRIFLIILSIPHNTPMRLNNVMQWVLWQSQIKSLSLSLRPTLNICLLLQGTSHHEIFSISYYVWKYLEFTTRSLHMTGPFRQGIIGNKHPLLSRILISKDTHLWGLTYYQIAFSFFICFKLLLC